METIAVYWEPKIRIYGLRTHIGLSLYTVIFPVERLAYWGGRSALLEEAVQGFELVNLQTFSARSMRLCLLLAQDGRGRVHRMLEQASENEDATSWQTVAPVELIYLHGPHFQDRYGIAEAAIAPLHDSDIPILAAGCSGTSVYLVVPENMAGMATSCLSGTFLL